MKYRYHTENIGTRYREAELLRALSDRANDGDEAAQTERFRQLLAMRAARKERFPYEYDYEARTEQIEGSANYVELKALEQISQEKAAKERERLLASMEDVSHCFPVRPLEGDYPLVSPNIYDARYRAPYITSRFFVAYKDENEETQVIREPMLLIETDGNLSIKKVYRA